MTYVELQVTTHFSFLRGVSSAEECSRPPPCSAIPRSASPTATRVGGLVNAPAGRRRDRGAADRRLPARSDGRHRPAGLAGGSRRLVAPHPPAHRRQEPGRPRARARRANASSTGRMSPPDRTGLVAALVPDEADAGDRGRARPAARHLRRPRPSRPHPSPPAGRCGCGSTRSTRWRGATASRGLATGDVLYDSPDKRMLQDVVTAIRHKCTIDDLGFRRERYADRHLKAPAEMERRFAAYPDAIRASADIAERCTFSLRELSYQYPDEIVMSGRTPAAGAGAADPRGARPPNSRRARPKPMSTLLEQELGLVEQLRLRALFPDRELDRRIRPQPGHTLPGPGLGRQFDDLLRARDHLDRSGQAHLLFERFISGEPQRAARYRRRFRA